MLCALILYVSGRTYSLTSTSNNRLLRNFYMAGLFYSLNCCQKSAEKKSPKKYFFSYFVLMPDMGFEWALKVFARNLLRGNCRKNIFFFSYFLLIPDLGYETEPTHYLLDHGDLYLKHNHIISSGLTYRSVFEGAFGTNCNF